MNRDPEIEKRINKITYYDNLYKINSYGGMGMDGLSAGEKKLRLQELDYIRNHPEIYNKNNSSRQY